MKLPRTSLVVLSVLALFVVAVAYAQKSDLPEGWDEPTELPPGAVRIEDLNSPYGSVPTHTTTPGSIPPAPVAPASVAPAPTTSVGGTDSGLRERLLGRSRWLRPSRAVGM